MTPVALALVMLPLLQAPVPASGFQWNGKAIHPGCVEELMGELADPHAVVTAVDLEGCHKSNRYADQPVAAGGGLRWQYPEAEGGFFQYEYLGALSSGVHVVRVGESGGGSGFFQSLVYLRFRESAVLEDGRSRSRQTLELVGSDILGDRAEVSVGLKGDVVTIRRREFRGAIGPGPEETIERIVR